MGNEIVASEKPEAVEGLLQYLIPRMFILLSPLWYVPVCHSVNAQSHWEVCFDGVEKYSPTKQLSKTELPTILRLQTSNFQLHYAFPAKKTWDTIDSIAHQCVIACNGPFFTPQGKPLGLMIHKGRVIQKLRDISWWGVFWIDNFFKPHITTTKRFKVNSPPQTKIAFALQAGPVLLLDGKPMKIPERAAKIAARRTLLGLDKKARVYIILFRQKVFLSQVQQILKNLPIHSAINLDGGNSTQISCQRCSPPVAVAGFPLPVFLCFSLNRSAR